MMWNKTSFIGNYIVKDIWNLSQNKSPPKIITMVTTKRDIINLPAKPNFSSFLDLLESGKIN